MKLSFLFLAAFLLCSRHANAQTTLQSNSPANHLYLDVHYLPGGKVKLADVAAAHAKDLAVENKYGVQFQKYWVDEEKGLVYCLSSSPDTASIRKTHGEAHGLLPQQIYQVTDGMAALPTDKGTYFLDIHNLGEGKVTPADVAQAHQKDLAVQGKYGVHFINYWLDQKNGVVFCLSQASDSTRVIKTHKEAHGLLPNSIESVKQGQ